MALNFPSPPYDGQIYVDPTSNSKYVYVAAKSTWKSIQHVPVVVSYGFNKANSAYLTANAAYDMANAAYNSQNVDYTLSNSAFTHANAAYDFSNSAYASINSNWTVQNALYTVANASFAVANAALPNVSNAVFNGNLRVTGNLQIGSNTITITNNHIIANDYYRMNTGGHMVAVTDGNLVNAVYALVNVSFNTANASYASANNVGPQIAPTYNTANAAYNTSNASFGVANAAYGAANNVGPQIAPAFNTANAAYNTSNASFGKANTALQNTSGVSFNGDFYVPSGKVGIGNTSPVGQLTITAANTVGGTGYADFLRVTNASYPAVTNPVKTFRLNQSGGFEIINNAYSAVIMSLTDGGSFAVGSRGIASASLPSGSILQVVYAQKTGAQSFASTSYQTISGLSATITPISTSSRILIHVACSFSGNPGWATGFRVLRNGTFFNQPTSGSPNPAGSPSLAHFGNEANGSDGGAYVGFTTVDSPASTSALTYEVALGTEGNQTTIIGVLSRGANSSDPGYPGAFLTTLTVMEVA